MSGPAMRERMNVVIVGHVDHGKSTIIGRLLADTNTLPEGKLDQVRQMCRTHSRPFEYAFLLDALKDERSQGITIDSARVFFRSEKRDYIIIDAPGHIEFLKNMISGAARAQAALLVIDAQEGVQENSYRHGYLLSFLGVRRMAVVVNKMDLVDYDRGRFEAIREEYSRFLGEIGITPDAFVPVSGREGDNLIGGSGNTPYYTGPGVLGILDSFASPPLLEDRPFRLPVQDVYRFTRFGDDRRIVAGTVESGCAAPGDELVFYPSGKRSRIATIERFAAPTSHRIGPGVATGLTLTEQIYVTRGQVARRCDQPPPVVGTRLLVRLFWLGHEPMVEKKDYIFRLNTTRTRARLESVRRIIDARTLGDGERADAIGRHDVAECVLRLQDPVAFDAHDTSPSMARFVIVDDYEIRGGGIIQESLEDEVSWVREKVILRNVKWEPSHVPLVRRAEKYNQRATLILITGGIDSPRKEVAKELESRMFEDGRIVYYFGIGSLKYGLDADLTDQPDPRNEHFRRLGELAHIILDVGAILIVTALELNRRDLEYIKATVDPDRVEVVWLGETISTEINLDLHLSHGAPPNYVSQIKRHLQERGIIYRPR